MIYFLSDVHENINFVGLQKYLEIATKNDLLIILGDIGLNFSDNKENRNFTEKFLRINKNIAFIEGNHENFAFLDGFPVEEWKGGKVNRISKNIVRLMRGNIYDIDERKFFAFGGHTHTAQKRQEAKTAERAVPSAPGRRRKHGRERKVLVLTVKANPEAPLPAWASCRPQLLLK